MWKIYETMSDEKIVDLARKLKALAERGVGGEKENAAQKLKRLLAKHGISIEEIESAERSEELFKYKNGQQQILLQCIRMVMGMETKIYSVRRLRNAVIVECTKAEFLEIKATFEFYSKAYERDLKLFLRAFIQKNRLFPSDGPKTNMGELTGQELAEAEEIMIMAESIRQRSPIRKQLNGKLYRSS
jgi:hypothetical protein